LFPNTGQDSSTTECNGIAGPAGTGAILAAGKGNLIIQFRVGSPVTDNSLPPSQQTFFSLPTTTDTPRVVRTFKFDRLNGQWSINGQFMDCNEHNGHHRFTVQQNTSEHWLLTNLTGDWTHPVHIHLEEHQILSRNRQTPTVPEDLGRKDVVQLHPNER